MRKIKLLEHISLDADTALYGRIAHLLMQHNLIDEYYLTINPIILGEGFPLFTTLPAKLNLRLIGTKVFTNGAVGMQYAKE